MLAVAVLLAVLCCGTALADDYSFTTQPGNYTVNPDSEVTISWATNFNPVKIELLSDQGQLQTNPWTQEQYWVTDEKVVKTITTDLSHSMSEAITYDEAKYIRWKVRAYYSDDEVSYVASDFFRIDRTLRSITTPENTNVNPDSEVTISWTTNFNPVKIELVSDQGQIQTNPWTGEQYWASYEKVVKTITTDLSRSMSEVITYDEAAYLRWKVRAYYSDDEISYVASDFFEISRILRSITTPANVNVEPGKQVLISWKTNFNPISIEILQDQGYYKTNYLTQELYWVSNNRVVKTINSNLSRNMSIPMRYDEVSESYLWRDKWFVRAYSENDWATSDTFTIDYPSPTLLHVTFDSCGHGTAPKSQDIWIGHYATQPENPTADGFVFGGWYTGMDFKTKFSFSSPVLEDMTLYAWWGHTVSFDMNGKNENYNRSFNVREGQQAEPYTAYMNTDFSGWFLTGWYTEPECVNAFDFDMVITGDITLYAKWEYDGFTATFDWNGTHNVTSYKRVDSTHIDIYADEPQIQRARTGERFTEIRPLQYDGAGSWLSFAGWYTEPECMNLYDFTTIPAEDTTLYAGWGQNHTLVLHTNNPYGTYSSPLYCTIPYNEVPGDNEWLIYHLQHPGDYTGYVHAGWYTDEAGTVPFDPSEPLTGTVHVYSKWALAEYTVIFDVNGGTGMDNITLILHYGDAITVPAVQPTLTNYVFRGWTGSDGTNFYVWSPTKEIACTGDVTYSAYWVPDGVAINSSNFPDAVFRDFVAQYDTNEDGYLWASECDAVTNISIYNRGVTSLRGIENFTELKTLGCNGNALTSLYLARNEKLTTLRCNDNQLTSLDLSGNTVLTHLYAQNNCLTSLNIVNCRALTSAYIQNNPNLTDVVFAAPNLRTLQIQDTGITTLDLSACPGLAYAATNGSVYHYTTSGYSTYSADYENWYYQLSVTLYASVDGFITSGIPIDEAHFPDEGFRRLVGDRYHDLNGNGTLSQSEIDQAYSLNGGYSGTYSLEGIQYLPNISYIVLKNVGLEQIDLSANPLVNTLVVSGNHLNAVDVSMLAELTHLDVAKNPDLVTLTLGSAPLETLNCYQCPHIRSLDLSSQPHLLKAYMESDGYYSDDEYGQYMTYSWVNEGETVIGSLRVDPDIDIALPEWRWNSLEDVRFVMPDGSETAADVTRTVSPDGKTVTYTSAVVLDQVPFEDSKTYHLVTFAGADVPAQELEAGEAVAWPGIPFMAGSIFEGWYADADCTEEYIFGTAVSEGFTVYAKWTTPAPASFLKLPSALRTVESEAFAGTSAQAVIIPASVTSIAYDAFRVSDVAYIYGTAGTTAETFASAYGFTFVPIDDDWAAGH